MTVEQHTQNLLDSFIKRSAGLFEITGRFSKNFDQGYYGCAAAKPSKKMKSALAIDREVLVVVTTFRDQQQRTIKFISQEIEQAQGRFESTVAIVLHCDCEGNGKLRNWGRDKGLSILPVFANGGLSGIDSLERALCVELYSHDPFDVTGPVSDDANFYGRRDEAIDLARKLQRGQIRSCLGVRKIGKTSIINRVLREMRTAHDCTCIMVDCSRDDIWELDAPQLLNSIAKNANMAIGSRVPYLPLSPIKDANTINQARGELEKLLLSTDKPFVLVFDEVDYITPGSPTNAKWVDEFNKFWRNLRAAYQECVRETKNFSVLVAGVSTHWFTV